MLILMYAKCMLILRVTNKLKINIVQTFKEKVT